jgi:hypothetical protein
MSDFLTRLISVGREGSPPLRPRLPSRFAPTAPSTPPETVELEGSPTPSRAWSPRPPAPSPVAEPDAQRISEQRVEVSAEAPRAPRAPSEETLPGRVSSRRPPGDSGMVQPDVPPPLPEGSRPRLEARMDSARGEASTPEARTATWAQELPSRSSSASARLTSEVASEERGSRPGLAGMAPTPDVPAPLQPPRVREARVEKPMEPSSLEAPTATGSTTPARSATSTPRARPAEPAAPDEARAAHLPARWPASASDDARDTREAAASMPRESPTVRITIGRIEVRATTPSAAPSQRPSSRTGPAMSLEAYLKRRGGGGS